LWKNKFGREVNPISGGDKPRHHGIYCKALEEYNISARGNALGYYVRPLQGKMLSDLFGFKCK